MNRINSKFNVPSQKRSYILKRLEKRKGEGIRRMEKVEGGQQDWS